MHPTITQQQEQAYWKLHDEYTSRAHGKGASAMPQQMIVSRTPIEPLILIIGPVEHPEFDRDLGEWIQITPTGTAIYGETREQVEEKLADAIRLFNTNCPSCGWHTSERVCPECGQDREWYASEVGGMWGEHIQHGQA